MFSPHPCHRHKENKMKVSIERYIQQVRDGVHYKGHVKIADTQLEYELVFAVPIPKLDDMESPNGITEIRRLFQLTVKRNNANIELTDGEYGFFLQMLAELAIDFYNNPQTRDNNEGMMGQMLQGRGPMSVFGASVSIGITSTSSHDFEPALCEMLSAPKFGCALA